MYEFKVGQIVEWSAGAVARLTCVAVIDDIDMGNVYAILYDQDLQQYAPAHAMCGDDNDGWYFVVDDDKGWVSEKHIALAQIVIVMAELMDTSDL